MICLNLQAKQGKKSSPLERSTLVSPHIRSLTLNIQLPALQPVCEAQAAFGIKEIQTNFEGIRCSETESHRRVWNEGIVLSVPDERNLRVCISQEINPPLRFKGKNLCFLSLSPSAPRFSPTMDLSLILGDNQSRAHLRQAATSLPQGRATEILGWAQEETGADKMV